MIKNNILKFKYSIDCTFVSQMMTIIIIYVQKYVFIHVLNEVSVKKGQSVA